MRARLGTMHSGQQYSFLCVPKMAEKMDRVVRLAGGEICERDDRTYGIVISVRKI